MTLAELALTIALLGALGLDREPVRPLRDPRLPPRRDHPRAERAGLHPPRAALRGDRLRRGDRAHLPPVLPRPRVQRRPSPAERPARRARRRRRLPHQRRPRAARRRRGVRRELRGDRGRGVHLRLVERDRRQGADGLPAPCRRRDRPGARDPPLRGRRHRGGARVRRDGGRRPRDDGDRVHEGDPLRRRRRSSRRSGSAPTSVACSSGSSSSSSSSRCSASSRA